MPVALKYCSPYVEAAMLTREMSDSSFSDDYETVDQLENVPV